jgi:hypothetical protein
LRFPATFGKLGYLFLDLRSHKYLKIYSSQLKQIQKKGSHYNPRMPGCNCDLPSISGYFNNGFRTDEEKRVYYFRGGEFGVFLVRSF